MFWGFLPLARLSEMGEAHGQARERLTGIHVTQSVSRKGIPSCFPPCFVSRTQHCHGDPLFTVLPGWQQHSNRQMTCSSRNAHSCSGCACTWDCSAKPRQQDAVTFGRLLHNKVSHEGGNTCSSDAKSSLSPWQLYQNRDKCSAPSCSRSIVSIFNRYIWLH